MELAYTKTNWETYTSANGKMIITKARVSSFAKMANAMRDNLTADSSRDRASITS